MVEVFEGNRIYGDIKENGAEYAKDLLKAGMNVPLIPLGLLPSKAISHIEKKIKGWYVPDENQIYRDRFLDFSGARSIFKNYTRIGVSFS